MIKVLRFTRKIIFPYSQKVTCKLYIVFVYEKVTKIESMCTFQNVTRTHACGIVRKMIVRQLTLNLYKCSDFGR